MLFNGTNTIYNIKLQNAKSIGVTYSILANTTLNEKFGIEVVDSLKPLKEYPNLNLITLGVNEEFKLSNKATRLNLTRSRHSPIDAALFNHIPFYLRPLTEVNDNPPSDSIRLTKVINIQGVDHLAGYGYVLNDIEYKNDILVYNNVQNDYVNVSKLDTNDATLLNPIPKSTSELDLANNNTYVTDFLKAYVYMTELELLEIKNAMDILYTTTPTITEIGVCNSLIKTLENGKLENYAVQIAYFADVDIDINKAIQEKSLEFYIDLGGMDVLVI